MKWIIACLAAAVLVLGGRTMAVERPPNVVLFLVDDLGWRDLGCYGSPSYQTPNIDRFAQSAVRFTDAYAACHVCSPTRASILTGKYPARLKLTDWLPGRKDFPFQRLLNAEIEPAVPSDEVTLAEVFRDHGYRTAHLGKWHLGEEPLGPTSQGFEMQVPRWNKGWPKAGYFAPFQMEGLVADDGSYLTDCLTDHAVDFIRANQQSPFFLYLAHFAVHDPIQGPKELVDQYEQAFDARVFDGPEYGLEGNPDDEVSLSRSELSELMSRPGWSGFRVLPRRTVKIKQRQDNPQFAAMVQSVDRSLGRLIGLLEELKIHDETIIVFFSDNGGMSAANFGNPRRRIPSDRLDKAFSTSNLPLRAGKGWLYEGGIRVPLIIRWTGDGRAGAVCPTPVISTDLYPTILEMAGLDPLPEQHQDGVSLVPLLRGEKRIDRQAIYWHFPHYSNHGMQSPGGAVRSGDFKLIEYFENGTHQLFNLRSDPGEKNDLSDTLPDKAAELKSMLKVWRTEVGAEMMEVNPQFVDP
ncbi:sulfatase [Roseiconus nitratireducens]|nr:sulfatase [Roseiconus nitratireducens]